MSHPTLDQTQVRGRWTERLGQLVKVLGRGALATAMTMVVYGPARLVSRYLARKREAGDVVWLDDLTFGSRRGPGHTPAPQERADLTPDRSVKSRKSRVIKHDGYPEPDYPFAYRRPPLSGNVANGLDEPSARRPRKVYHTMDYSTPWGGMELYLHATNTANAVSRIVRGIWDNRDRRGPLAPVRRTVDDPAGMTATLVDTMREVGAALVGVAELAEHHLYEGAKRRHRYAVSLAVTMDREAMLTAPEEPSRLAVLDAYVDVGQLAIDLAKRIRALGWEAEAHTNNDFDASDVVHVPVAIDAGLGQLGKHGSLITVEHGSNVRLATVLTDLPLVPSAPVDIGVDDFCASCQVCVTNCPPHAIFDTKQLVRGEVRWYVDFDTCTPYFSANGGCGICIEVCPWSEEGRGSFIRDKMLARRTTTHPRLGD
ncbi:MAG: 4Fe-4S dicluster domain-containing protein [Myxococcota bacterium]